MKGRTRFLSDHASIETMEAKKFLVTRLRTKRTWKDVAISTNFVHQQ